MANDATELKQRLAALAVEPLDVLKDRAPVRVRIPEPMRGPNDSDLSANGQWMPPD